MTTIPKLDLTSQKFGFLTPIEIVGKDEKGNYLWKCQCDCGNIVTLPATKIKNGYIKSCGCYKSTATRIAHTTHGKKHTRLYRIWAGMKCRCNNPYSEFNRNYAGRGITVCDKWKNSFESFYEWAMQNGYSDGLSIDRIDVNGNYDPDNCRWATYIEQCNNTRNSVYLTYGGKTQTEAQWAREKGIRLCTLHNRINNLGWSVERALTEPIHTEFVSR